MKPSPEIADRLIAFIKGGAEPETAAEVCGISPETFDLWKSDLDFLKRLDTALAEARYARTSQTTTRITRRVPREMGRYITASTGLLFRRLGWSSATWSKASERATVGLDQIHSFSYIDPTHPDYIRRDSQSQGRTTYFVI